MDEKTIKKLNTFISAVFIIAALFFFGAAIANRNSDTAPKPKPKPETESPSSVTSETQEYNDLDGMKRLEIAKSFASWTPGAQVESEKVESANLQVVGNISKAYLNVKASVEGKPLSKYESFFLKFNDVGGHLFRPLSLKTPDDASTSLLYELSDVPVLPSVPYDEKRTPEKFNLTDLLIGGKTVKLTAFISSLRPALIEEMSISYVCVDSSECAISLK